MLRYIISAVTLTLISISHAAAFDHSSMDTLLKKHVVILEQGKITTVDYHGMSENREDLRAYLQLLSAVTRDEFDSWAEAKQLAFLINAYNAWTIELILGRYPDLKSIKDLGSFFKSPWKERFIPLLGETRSLDEVEHDLIRGSGRYNEPRIHFAVNCASIGCPALRNEAYVAENLESQLEEATHNFLADRKRNKQTNEKLLEISSVFKWYRGDFELGWRGASTLAQFLALYSKSLGLSVAQEQLLREGGYEIKFLDYDWRLNDIH